MNIKEKILRAADRNGLDVSYQAAELIAEALDAEMEAENAGLRAEVERLKAVNRISIPTNTMEQWAASEIRIATNKLRQQLAASQLEAKRLRDIMQQIAGHPECTPPFYWWQIYAREALAQPSDTSSIDAYVAEKVNEYQKHNGILGREVKDLTRQRDLAVDALIGIESFAVKPWADMATKALLAIKESEVK